MIAVWLVGPPRLEEILTHGSGRANLSQLYRRKYEIKLTGIKPDEAIFQRAVAEALGE